MSKWEGKLDFYDQLLQSGSLVKEDEEPYIGPFGYYIECFKELNSCRSTLSLAPIPFTAIVEYARVYNIEDLDEFLYYIRRLDNLLLEKESKKNDRKDNTDKSD